VVALGEANATPVPDINGGDYFHTNDLSPGPACGRQASPKRGGNTPPFDRLRASGKPSATSDSSLRSE
ncbi:MAG TPA: hypothetical protein VNL15_01650, partial [Dehalococcoidia bacterium]|nr:hypothetical protein [Dehalococcoidia bacterium]